MEMSPAWHAISNFYGSRRAQRSGVLLLNHIYEGLVVLDAIGSTQAAKDAFCLHPLFQADDDLVANLPRAGEFSPHVMLLVMEYRARANEALSDRVIMLRGSSPAWVGKPATPGPLAEVRDMLIADKVQNYKDFLHHHHGSHKRSAELDHYFKVWLKALDVDGEEFTRLRDAINASK